VSHLPPQIAYSLLQGGVLLLLMARLVSQVAFQPQLSVIAGTFGGAQMLATYY
jgi:hypothetical protein